MFMLSQDMFSLDRGTWPEKDCNGGMQVSETLHCISRFAFPANNVLLSIPSSQEVSFFLENGTIFLLTDKEKHPTK